MRVLNLQNAGKSEEWKRTMVYSAKGEYPAATLRNIADAIKISPDDVSRILKEPAGVLLVEQLNKDHAVYISRIQNTAMTKFEEFINREDIKPETLLSALKFALAATMNVKEEKKPDALIFETVITPAGTLEQSRKETHRGVHTLEPDPKQKQPPEGYMPDEDGDIEVEGVKI